jgi:predicted dehydrogenase
MSVPSSLPTRVLRVLVVGLGSIGRRHLRVARDLCADAQFAVLRSGTGPVGAEIDGVTTYHSIDEALDFAPTIAVIASPATHHAGTAIRLAAAGVHLLVEKPLTDRLETARAVRDAVAAAGVTAAVGYNLRHLESLVALRHSVREGSIGRVMSVRSEVGQYLPEWRPDTDYRTTVSARRELGGGALLELSHELDYLLWLFGPVSSVTAMLSHLSDLDVDTEDSANLLLQFAPAGDAPPGAPGVVASVSLDFARRDVVRRCTVVGTTGTLEWDGVRGTVRQFDAATRAWSVCCDAPPERDATYRAEWADLLACIGTGRAPRADLDAGVAVLHVVDAARRSSESRRTVALVADGDFVSTEE